MGIRYTLLAVTITAALALPVLVHFTLEAGNQIQGLKLKLADLQRQESELPNYTRHAEQFRAHVAMLKEFSDAAERFGISDAHWDSHSVDISKMFVSYSEVEGFIADMSTARDSYFVPDHLQIETRPTVTYQDVAAAGGRGEVSEGGVQLSLTGEFLVNR